MVEEIEEIGSGLEGQALVDFELVPEREIDLGGAESVEDVAAEVAQGRLRRRK